MKNTEVYQYKKRKRIHNKPTMEILKNFHEKPIILFLTSLKIAFNFYNLQFAVVTWVDDYQKKMNIFFQSIYRISTANKQF